MNGPPETLECEQGIAGGGEAEHVIGVSENFGGLRFRGILVRTGEKIPTGFRRRHHRPLRPLELPGWGNQVTLPKSLSVNGATLPEVVDHIFRHPNEMGRHVEWHLTFEQGHVLLDLPPVRGRDGPRGAVSLRVGKIPATGTELAVLPGTRGEKEHADVGLVAK